MIDWPMNTLVHLLTTKRSMQPQRPLRTLRMRDENQIPTISALPGKQIHQRNKSSPALTTQAGKTGAKRTVFADVSNTVRPLNVAKDDTALNGKTALQPLKEVKAQETTRNTGLLRPAQRPLSVAGIKGFLNNLTSSGTTSARTASLDNHESHPANTAKTVTKRGTTVFREVEPVANVVPRESAIPQRVVTSQAGHQPVEQISHLARVNAIYDPRLDVAPQIQLPEYHDMRSDGAGLYDINMLPEVQTDVPSFFEPLEVYEDAAAHLLPEVEPIPGVQQVILPPVSEVDYWEEDVYEEHFDEEGYTTARSMRSKGDYTTGGTTVLLAPKVTAKVEQELAEAREIVLQTKAANELEDDESWDTSMVAEYGEEIFDYMRKLEVCSADPQRSLSLY